MNSKRRRGFIATKKCRFLLWAQLVVGALLFLPISAFSEAPFYQGKTITLILSQAPGGLADTQTRLVIDFLGKYIPGRPQIVMEYMPGAGGRKATNHLYNAARSDGLTFGRVSSGMVPQAVMGSLGVRYDIDKLIYLGSTNYESDYVFFTRKELGLNTLAKLRSASGIRIGTQSVGGHLYIQSRLFAYMLGLKEPRFVTGYSSSELYVAVDRGELDTRASSIQGVLKRRPEWLEKMDFYVVFEVPKGRRDPRFAHLPELESFAKSDRERRLLELWRALRNVGPVFILPPGTPSERAELLREAFRKTLRDREFHEEFEKRTGRRSFFRLPEEVQKIIDEIPREPKAIEVLKELAGAKPLPPG